MAKEKKNDYFDGNAALKPQVRDTDYSFIDKYRKTKFRVTPSHVLYAVCLAVIFFFCIGTVNLYKTEVASNRATAEARQEVAVLRTEASEAHENYLKRLNSYDIDAYAEFVLGMHKSDAETIVEVHLDPLED